VSRLADLSAHALCSVVRLQARKHCEELCAALGTTAATLPMKTPLEAQVEALVAFAKTGAWSVEADVKTTLREVYCSLYRSAAHPFSAPMPRTWLADPEDSLALLARACLARVAVAADEPVPRLWLATLADCVEKTVRNAVKDGGLVCFRGEYPAAGGKEERPVSAESARAWLGKRGVAGFDEAAAVVESR